MRSVVDPIAGGAEAIVSPVSDAWNSFTEYDDLEAENEQLRDELEELRGNSIRTSAAEDALRDLLQEIEIDYIGGADSIVAQVIDRPGNFESYSVEIDRGGR